MGLPQQTLKVIAGCCIVFAGRTQSVALEGMAGHHSAWYQQTAAGTLSDSSQWGFFHVSTLRSGYSRTDYEIMTQSYLTFSPAPWLRLNAGTFFADAPGLSPSASLHFQYKGRHFSLLVVPRSDIRRHPSVDLMTLVEVECRISAKWHFYAKIQLLEGRSGNSHGRSYHYLRVGLSKGDFRTGLALNLDAYGKEREYVWNAGLFVRKQLFQR
jgi:hypothetical protein